ncbi:MAG: hypothetical protein M1269_03615 [Chloroflexi bacterium]|nr:hypothetical protein [Chloroflexota bacterium]
MAAPDKTARKPNPLKKEVGPSITIKIGGLIMLLGLVCLPVMLIMGLMDWGHRLKEQQLIDPLYWSTVMWAGTGLIVLGVLVVIIGYINKKAAAEQTGTDIPCPNCGHTYRLPEGVKKFECPLCRRKAVVDSGKAFVLPE